MILQIFSACASLSEPPNTVKSWLKTKTNRPLTVPYPVTTPSPGTFCSPMPKSWLRCSTKMSHSSKESGASKTSMRSRAVSLPLSCCAWTRREPPPARAAARFSSNRRRISFMGAQTFATVISAQAGIQARAPRPLPWTPSLSRDDAGRRARQNAGRLNSTSEDEMAESELYKKGAAKRRQLMGDAAVEAAGKGVYSDPVMQKFLDVAIENVFGNLWTHPGLDDKTRALICVISDTCTGREPELALHLRMALRQGWTEAELTEVLLHLSGYIGVPIIRESMLLPSRVFKESRAETGKACPPLSRRN